MWILPKNYPLSSHFAQDMVESKEDLTLPDLNIESSLMWRSKPSPLQTWCRRWKPDSYLPHLFTRILKPSQRTCFEEKLASSLAVIHVNHSVQQESDSEKMTPGTCGHTSGNTSKQLDLFNASLKTSKATLVLDSEKSSAIWKALVTKRRGEYSQRVKSRHPTKESESTSWPTATVFDVTGGSYPTELVNGQWGSKHSKDPNSPWYGAKLRDAVETAARMWPTPAARDYKGPNGYQATLKKIASGQRAQMGQLPNAVMVANKGSGHLNPEWVEWLMGVPTGWTELECWGTE